MVGAEQMGRMLIQISRSEKMQIEGGYFTDKTIDRWMDGYVCVCVVYICIYIYRCKMEEKMKLMRFYVMAVAF